MKAEAAKYKGFRCRPLPTLQALKTALAMRRPCGVAVHAGSSFQRINADGLLGVDQGNGNHAVCVDDLIYRNGLWLFDMPNSWGLQFGDRGRGYLTPAHFSQTIGVHTFWMLPYTQVKAGGS
jgi:hypothetical protein